MWIAKPLQALNESEKGAWARSLARLNAAGVDVPLAQTLTWAVAAEAVSGRAYLAFNPEEGVGGIVLASRDSRSGKVHFECVNGPLLHWDAVSSCPRQLATFAMAVSKLDREFGSMSLRPRWSEESAGKRLSHVPIPMHSESRAATAVVRVRENRAAQLASFSPRLRRTISVSERAGIASHWRPATAESLPGFVERMIPFGRTHGFTVPPLPWFEALTRKTPVSEAEQLTFWLADAATPEGFAGGAASASILVARFGRRAHYLFGCEERDARVRSALSPSALAHFRALLELQGSIDHYDLNGYESPGAGNPSYAGVARFKDQFGGEILRYLVPEFRIA